MPRVIFTENLKRHIDCPPADVEGQTVHDALHAVFALNPKLAHYVVDDQGRLREHMLIAVDGELVSDRLRLSDPVKPDSEIHVIQALSGG